jgi:hypothetical protein
MAAFRKSGGSLKAFAEAAGVPYSTLAYWRQRGEVADPPRFVPVEVARGGGPLEVVVGAVVVRVAPDFDEAHLVRVVRSLRAC